MATEKKAIVLEDPEVPTEILAKSIVDVAQAARKILTGALTKRAIVLLIHDACAGRVGKREIEDVLDTAADLQRKYVR